MARRVARRRTGGQPRAAQRRERAALVGTDCRPCAPPRCRALARRARRPRRGRGRRGRAAGDAGAAEARSLDVSGRRQDRHAGGFRRRDRRRRRDVRQRADAGAASPHRGAGRPEDHRSHAAHSRHLRQARADARGQAAGGARAARVPAAAARGRRRRVVAAGRRHRHAGPWRNEARDRPAPDPHAHPRGVRSHRAGAPAPGTASRAAAESVGADRRARRLHECRKDDAVQRADARGCRGVRCALRDARSAHSSGEAARQPRAARLRHGRIHRPAAARARRRLSRDARGSRGCGSDSPRDGRGRRRIASGRWRPSGRCSRRWGRSTCR